jgi:aryl-alcohol dehydrogenase-like predicted oxidoreductase
MKMVNLGQSDALVSELCLGTMFFGSKVPREMSHKLMDIYFENGGNFIDSANVYYAYLPGFHGGESEQTIGEWIKTRPDIRSRLFIATKVGVGMDGLEQGLRPQTIIEQCEKSLQRLGVETIDLYYLHIDDRLTPLETILEAYGKLKAAGKIRYVGASNFLAWRLEEALWTAKSNDLPEICCIQSWCTYLQQKQGAEPMANRTFVNDELRDFSLSRGLTILGYETLLRGVYSDPDKPLREQFNSPENMSRLELVRKIAKESNISPSQVVYAWMRQSNPPVIPIVTASKEEHLIENIRSADVTLTTEQLDRMHRVF